MLTPHIVTEPEQTQGQARAEDLSRKRAGAKDTRQRIDRARLTEDYYVRAVSFYTDGNRVAALAELDNALKLRPTYLEALRLKERITAEMSLDEMQYLERIMLDNVEQKDSKKWLRR